MKLSIYVDQCVLEYWTDKQLNPKKVEDSVSEGDRDRYLKHTFDLVDAFIVAFIQDLNPQNDEIRKHLWRGHFLIKLSWLLEQMPLLRINEETLYRRLRWLKMMGILECIHRTVEGSGNRQLAYYKLSPLFWKIHEKRHDEATKAAKKVNKADSDESIPIVHRDDGETIPHSPQGHSPSPTGTRNESIKDSLSTLPPGRMPDATGAPAPAEKRDSLGVVSQEAQTDPPLSTRSTRSGSAGPPVPVREHHEEVSAGLSKLFHALNTGNLAELEALKEQARGRVLAGVA